MRHFEEIKEYEPISHMHMVCYVLVWFIFIYSSIIQYKYIEIPHALLILGIMLLIAFLFTINGRSFSLNGLFSRECSWLVAYQTLMLPLGLVSAVAVSNHISLWVTSAEYLFFMLVLTALVRDTDTDSFVILLVIVAVLLSVYLIKSPVLYTTGRYSISLDMNPNGLGMYFATGIWSVLYLQIRKKVPLILSLVIISLMLYSLLQTGSRKALIGSGIVVLGWLFFCFFSSLKGYSTWKQIFYLFLIVFSAVAIVSFFSIIFEQSIISERMKRILIEATEGERNQLYQLGLSLFWKQPLTGYGFGGFTYYQGEHSHSTFIEVPVTGGLFSAILYFTPYFVSIRKCFVLLDACKKTENMVQETLEIKMLLVLWASMLFYATCVVHPYQFLSYLIFGIIFGKIVYLEKKVENRQEMIKPIGLQKCRYIR